MGEFFALLTAAFWASAVICFRLAGRHVPPLLLNLTRVAVSSVLLLGTMLVVGQPPWREATGGQYALMITSGVVAIALADTLFHASLNRVGAGLTAIIECLYSPLTALFAFLILAERLTAGDLVGMVLVVAAVVLGSRTRLPDDVSGGTLLAGLALGARRMGALSAGSVIVKRCSPDGPSSAPSASRSRTQAVISSGGWLPPALATSSPRKRKAAPRSSPPAEATRSRRSASCSLC